MEDQIILDDVLLQVIDDKTTLSKSEYHYDILENDSSFIIVSIQDAHYKDEELGKLYLDVQKGTYEYDINDMAKFNDFCRFDEATMTTLIKIRHLAKELLSFISAIASSKSQD